MADRYVVCEGKSVMTQNGKVFRAGTIVKHDQICGTDGRIDPGMIRDGFIREFSDRPSEQLISDLERARQIDAQMSKGANPAKMVPVFDNPTEILDATLEELRVFADEHLGMGRGEFQPEESDEIRSELLALKKHRDVGRKEA